MEHKIGLLCGRFQPVHKGHISLIREALKHCDHLIIAIGSAQESGTKRNPFDYETRKELLRRSMWGLGARVTMIPINDRTVLGDDFLVNGRTMQLANCSRPAIAQVPPMFTLP